MNTLSRWSFVLLLVAVAAVAACARGSDAEAAPCPLPVPESPAWASAAPAAPAELAPFRQQLLQLAFRAASALPLDPHRKNRSRLQAKVTAACFDLEQPQLAVAFARNIADWRRGCAYADYAWASAKCGDTKTARDYIELAGQVARAEQSAEHTQDWQIDTIHLKVARAHAALGDDVKAARAAAGIEPSSEHAVDLEWAQTAAERVRRLSPEQVAEELAAIDASFAQLSLGQQQVALATLARLHERCFAEAHGRWIEDRVVATWTKLPPELRLDTLCHLVQTCLAKTDGASALRLLASAREIARSTNWRVEDRIPQLASLAALRHRAGESEQARADAEVALALYHTEREQIVDIYRAETVCSLAVALHTMGDAAANDLCALAIEEGLVNPNSRPRAEDLVETCVAMAVHGMQPSAPLWQRLTEVCEGLNTPW